jgi:hypothetical protein
MLSTGHRGTLVFRCVQGTRTCPALPMAWRPTICGCCVPQGGLAAAAQQAVLAACCRRLLQIPPSARSAEDVSTLTHLLQALEVRACILTRKCMVYRQTNNVFVSDYDLLPAREL